MVCVACGVPADQLCRSCRLGLHVGRARVTLGLRVVPAFRHEGTARRLVHQLKYQASRPAAVVLAAAMVRTLPPDASTLVPVPRSWDRRLRFGVDPALELARLVGRMAHLPVERALVSPLWVPSRAGRKRAERRLRSFRVRPGSGRPAVLVDDVITTGRTLSGAAGVLGHRVIGAVTATGAGV